MTTYGGIIEKAVPLPLVSVVPELPVNEPVLVVLVVFVLLPSVVPVEPVKLGATEFVFPVTVSTE